MKLRQDEDHYLNKHFFSAQAMTQISCGINIIFHHFPGQLKWFVLFALTHIFFGIIHPNTHHQKTEKKFGKTNLITSKYSRYQFLTQKARRKKLITLKISLRIATPNVIHLTNNNNLANKSSNKEFPRYLTRRQPKTFPWHLLFKQRKFMPNICIRDNQRNEIAILAFRSNILLQESWAIWIQWMNYFS